MAVTFEPPPTYAEVVLVDKEGKKPRFNPIWLKWFVDIAALLTASGGGGGVISHNSLGGLQGGTTAQYYHLTAAQRSSILTLIGITGISVTITTAKLTGGGADGSMTFTNGLLTAQTAAT